MLSAGFPQSAAAGKPKRIDGSKGKHRHRRNARADPVHGASVPVQGRYGKPGRRNGQEGVSVPERRKLTTTVEDMANMLKKIYKGTIDRMQRDFEAGDLSRFPELGRNVLNEFLRNNLYKYDVIIMKDTDTGTQTYIVADKGPMHPVRNGSQDGQKK